MSGFHYDLRSVMHDYDADDLRISWMVVLKSGFRFSDICLVMQISGV